MNKATNLSYLYITLLAIVCLCLFDAVYYQSQFIIFLSVVLLFVSWGILFFLDTVKNVSYSIGFIILAYSFYAFTTGPYTADAEKNAFFIIGPLIFIALISAFVGQKPKTVEVYLTFTDRVLLIFIMFFLFISEFIINSEEITEDQGILKFISVGGSLILFAYYFARYLYSNENVLILFLKIWVYIGIASGVFGLMTVVNPGLIPNNDYPGLATSFYKHPNATSSIYNFTIPITIWFVIFKKDKISFLEKWVFSAGAFISFVALFFTMSRFGIAMVFLSGMILFYKYSRKIFFATIVLMLVSSSFLVANFFSSKGSLTVFGRVGLLQTALEMFKDDTHFLFGYGGIITKKVFEDTKFSIGVGDLNNSPHNIILYSILLYGVFFTVSLFIYFLKYYFASLKDFLKYNVSSLMVLSLSVVSGLFIKNMGEDLLFFQDAFMWYLFLVFFGFLMIEVSQIRNKKLVDNRSEN